MISLVVAVLAASLLGSFHCAGMCGAFVAIACGAMEGDRSKQRTLAAAYHLGRLAVYVLLGLAAGAMGRLIDLTGALAGLRSVATPLAGVLILLFASITFVRARGGSLPRPKLPARWLAVVQTAHRAAMNQPPVARAAAIGILTPLLPCGWLYAFVATAAGAGKPLSAAAVMAVFWAGTLPALTLVGVGARALLGRSGRHLSTLSSLAVAVVAIFMIAGRARLDPAALAAMVQRSTTSNQAPDPTAEKACCRVNRPADAAKPSTPTP